MEEVLCVFMPCSWKHAALRQPHITTHSSTSQSLRQIIYSKTAPRAWSYSVQNALHQKCVNTWSFVCKARKTSQRMQIAFQKTSTHFFFFFLSLHAALSVRTAGSGFTPTQFKWPECLSLHLSEDQWVTSHFDPGSLFFSIFSQTSHSQFSSLSLSFHLSLSCPPLLWETWFSVSDCVWVILWAHPSCEELCHGGGAEVRSRPIKKGVLNLGQWLSEHPPPTFHWTPLCLFSTTLLPSKNL